MTAKATARELKRALRGANHIGDLVLWRAGGNVRPDELRGALDEQDLNSIPVPLVSPEAAFSSAVREAAKATGHEATILRNDVGAIAYAFVRSSVADDAQVGDSAGTVANRVAWLKAVPDALAQQVDAEFPVLFDIADDSIASLVKTKWEHASTHISARTIRDIVASTMATWGAVRLHRGGIYFVSAQHADDVRKLRSAMATVGTTIYLMPQADLDDSKAALGEAAREHISSRINELREEANRWKESARNPRQGTIEARIETYSEIRTSLKDMVEILAVHGEDLLGEIDSLSGACKVMLGVDVDEDPEQETDPDAGTDEGPSQAPETADTAPEEDEQAQTTEDGDEHAPAPPARPGRPTHFADMTMADLRRKARELSIGSKGLNKQALISALVQATA